MSNMNPNIIKKSFEEQVVLISTMSDVYLDEKQGFELFIAMSNALDYINDLEDKVERLKKKQKHIIHIDISEQYKKECEHEIKIAKEEAIKELMEVFNNIGEFKDSQNTVRDTIEKYINSFLDNRW